MKKIHFTENLTKEIVEDYNNDYKLSAATLARHYRVSQCLMIRLLKKQGCIVEGYKQRHGRYIRDAYMSQIIELYKTKSTLQIARQLNINDETVREILIENQISRKNKKKDDVQMKILPYKNKIIEDFSNQTRNGNELARKYGVHSQTLYNYLHKWGVPIYNKIEEMMEVNRGDLIATYQKEKLTFRELGKSYDVSAGVISDYFKKWGVKIVKGRTSGLERFFEEKFLTPLNLTYKKQFQIKNRFFDFYFPSKNLIIEVDGDYWHGNPKIYKEFSNKQNDTKKNDQLKEKMLIDNNIDLIRFWEYDIRKFPEEIEKILNEKFRS